MKLASALMIVLAAPGLALADCGDRLDELNEDYPLAMKAIGGEKEIRDLMRSARLLDESSEEGLCDEVVDKLESRLSEVQEELEEEEREQKVAEAERLVLQNGIVRASDLLEQTVYSEEDESLGEVVEVALHAGSGRIAYVVLEFGGFLGFGKKLAAIPWSELRRTGTVDDTVWVVALDEERLEKIARIDKDNWPQGVLQRFPAVAPPTQVEGE